MSTLKNKILEVEMPDGRLWAVPVMIIAQNRAEFYFKLGRDGYSSIEESLAKDTIPLFESDDYEIKDWAASNMNWSDVKDHAFEIETLDPEPVDYEEGWVNGTKKILLGTLS